jgi:hypothetical protein
MLVAPAQGASSSPGPEESVRHFQLLIYPRHLSRVARIWASRGCSGRHCLTLVRQRLTSTGVMASLRATSRWDSLASMIMAWAAAIRGGGPGPA